MKYQCNFRLLVTIAFGAEKETCTDGEGEGGENY